MIGLKAEIFIEGKKMTPILIINVDSMTTLCVTQTLIKRKRRTASLILFINIDLAYLAFDDDQSKVPT
jgi:hypothetical protein